MPILGLYKHDTYRNASKKFSRHFLETCGRLFSTAEKKPPTIGPGAGTQEGMTPMHEQQFTAAELRDLGEVLAYGSSDDKRKITRSLEKMAEAAETAQNARLEIASVIEAVREKQALDAARDRELDRNEREAYGIR